MVKTVLWMELWGAPKLPSKMVGRNPNSIDPLSGTLEAAGQMELQNNGYE
jgi:hypothetical protein